MFNFHKVLVIVFRVAIISILGISSCTKSQQYENPVFIGCEIVCNSPSERLTCFILEDGTGIVWKPEGEKIYISNLQLSKNELLQISDIFSNNDFLLLPRDIRAHVYDAFEETLCYATKKKDHYVKQYGTRNEKFERISDFLKQILEEKLRSERDIWEMTSNLEFGDYLSRSKSIKMIEEKLNNRKFAHYESVNYLYNVIIRYDLRHLKRGYENFKTLYPNPEFVGYKNHITNVKGFITEDARGFVVRSRGDQVKFAEFKLSQEELSSVVNVFRKKQFFNLSFFRNIANCDKNIIYYKTKTFDLNVYQPFEQGVNLSGEVDILVGEPINPTKKFEAIFTPLTQVFEEKLDSSLQLWESKSSIAFQQFLNECSTIINNLEQNVNKTSPSFSDCFLHH